MIRGREPQNGSARSASADTFLRLTKPYYGLLLRYIRKNMNHSEDAADVYQETLLRAFRYFESFDTDREFRPWLFCIAYHEIKRHYRKTKKFKALPLLELRIVREDTSRTLLVRDIFQSAENLNHKQRRAFLLYYLSGFRIKEIAEMLRQRESTISTILGRARRNLRNEIG